MGVGKRIREMVREKGISLHSLAEKAGISYNTLYSMVQRDSNRVSVETLQKICVVLDVPVWSLFETPLECSAERTMRIWSELGKFSGELSGVLDEGGVPGSLDKSEAINSLLGELANASGEMAILAAYNALNEKGREIAIDRMVELTKIPEYTQENKN